MATQDKISVYSLADLKNTSDDAIPNYLNSLKFTQSHVLSDIRLALGYASFFICAACFCWDYKFGFESTKLYSAIAVALYVIINSIYTFWIWAVEKGKVYVGYNKTGDKIEISTSTTKNVPMYNLHITVYTKAQPSKPTTITLSRPFSEWFDAAGHFVKLPFQQMFASNVPVIGQADPKRVVHGQGKIEKKKVMVDDGKSMDEKWASLLAESSGVTLDMVAEGVGASTATPSKGGKKRGKKA